jgi:hypothetical protein
MQLNSIKEIATTQADWQEKVGEITRFVIDTYNPKRRLYNATLDIKSVDNLNHSFTLKNAHPIGQALSRIGIANAIKDFVEEEKDGSYSFNDMDLLKELGQRKIDRIADNHRMAPAKIIYDDSGAKAVMTDRYQRLDNLPVLNATIAKHGEDITEKHSWISDNKMVLSYNTLKMTDLDTGEVFTKGGGGHSFSKNLWGSGVETSNSSIGYCSLTATIVMIRFACTNGLIASKDCIDVYKYKHTSDDLMQKLIFAQGELAEKAPTILNMIKKGMSRPAIISSVENFGKILSRYQIPKVHHEQILAQYAVEPLGTTPDGINGYGIYSAITRYASNIMTNLPAYDAEDVHKVLESAYPILTL